MRLLSLSLCLSIIDRNNRDTYIDIRWLKYSRERRSSFENIPLFYSISFVNFFSLLPPRREIEFYAPDTRLAIFPKTNTLFQFLQTFFFSSNLLANPITAKSFHRNETSSRNILSKRRMETATS